MEEAALEIEVGRLLYVSENLFVESGDYRHEVILYFLAADHRRPASASRSIRRMHEWHRPGDQPGPLLPPDVAAAVEADLPEGFPRPVLHLVTDERPVLRGGSSREYRPPVSSRRLGGVVVAIALAAAALPGGGFGGDRMARRP